MKKVIVGGVLLTLALIGVVTGSAKHNLTDAQRVAITSHCNETPKPWDC